MVVLVTMPQVISEIRVLRLCWSTIEIYEYLSQVPSTGMGRCDSSLWAQGAVVSSRTQRRPGLAGNQQDHEVRTPPALNAAQQLTQAVGRLKCSRCFVPQRPRMSTVHRPSRVPDRTPRQTSATAPSTGRVDVVAPDAARRAVPHLSSTTQSCCSSSRSRRPSLVQREHDADFPCTTFILPMLQVREHPQCCSAACSVTRSAGQQQPQALDLIDRYTSWTVEPRSRRSAQRCSSSCDG
jgi:hypothetical protein